MDFDSTQETLARELDRKDPLAPYRDRFSIPDPDVIYLDGNSLGRLPRATPGLIGEAVQEEWGDRLIRSWNESWLQKPLEIGGQLARLIGARPDEVMVCDTTSLNLFKLAVSALRARPDRRTIVSDRLNFPSDLYILQGVMDLLEGDYHLDLAPSPDTITVPEENLADRINDDTALVTLSHVSFKSAFMYDLAHITTMAHEAGALTLWDLSHAVGAVPLNLNEWGADLAVGCTYKYLNGGPGAPAFLFVRRDLQEELMPPIWGWFGAASPFDFDLDYQPAQGIQRFQVSTPHILSLLAVEPALEILLEAGMENLRKKSRQQSEYLLFLARELLFPVGYQLGSPEDASRRGSHVTLRHPEGYRICQALIDPPAGNDLPRVIPDFRTPDNIRLGIAPLYTTFEELHRAVTRMAEIVREKSYQEYSAAQKTVT